MISIVKNSFNSEIVSLESYISKNEILKLNEILDEEMLLHLRSIKKKEYDYRMIIITLYGLLESHVDKLIKNFLENLENEIEYYNFIDERIKKAHFSNSLSLATLLDQKNYPKFDHIDKSQVITNLYQCQTNQKPYSINKDSFLINTGNLKHNRIVKAFNSLGINLDQELRKKIPFNKKSENTFNTLDNLVDLRNEIAHGNILNILNVTEITPILIFLKDYFNCLSSIVESKAEQLILLYRYNYNSFSFGKTSIFSGNILGIKTKGKYNIGLMEKVIIKKNNGSFVVANILEKRVDRQFSTLKLDKNIKEGNEFSSYN